jgi:hypothetical protein
MKCVHVFAEILLRVQGVAGRIQRMERHLSLILILLDRMEKTMSDTKSELLAKLEALQAQVAEHTTNEGNKLAEAVAAARAAQQQEDKAASDAELSAALAKIDEISKGLIEFSPSGN